MPIQVYLDSYRSESMLIFIFSQFYNSFKYRKLFQVFHQTDY